jgi:hypothetical protein
MTVGSVTAIIRTAKRTVSAVLWGVHECPANAPLKNDRLIEKRWAKIQTVTIEENNVRGRGKAVSLSAQVVAIVVLKFVRARDVERAIERRVGAV